MPFINKKNKTKNISNQKITNQKNNNLKNKIKTNKDILSPKVSNSNDLVVKQIQKLLKEIK